MNIVTLEMLKKWRRDLHANPELSMEEFETKEYIKNILLKNSIEYKEVLATGLIVSFKSNEENKKEDTIIFRADIDALPIHEENKIEFRSKNDGIMHACGHDGHTAMLIGAVLETKNYYENNKVRFNTMFVFQPAEETIGGAGLLVTDYKDYFSKYNILASYALHLNPDYPENIIISKEKEIMASATEFRVDIKGKSAHVGLKYTGIDALNVASIFYQELLKLNTLNLKARDTNIIHVGKMWGGNALNIVAQSANLEGTIRTYKTSNYNTIKENILSIAEGLEKITNTKISVDFGEGYDAVFNNKEEYEIIKKVCKAENIEYKELPEAYLYGEDFSAFTKISTINYSFLGIRNEEKSYVSGLHTPTFNFDENILETGVKYYIGILKYYNK
ncbi:M20 family metallopeptidase [Gemella sp. zg-1178]|uniref:M20 metallopeptidase family protein n=1 Tax=Gemella sp. zg-1178 TaxID=2840372 RepID=UPI001C05DE2C|nr:M20 family metallopeptidase [Gemella sp. zg-1178]MBU0278065.1 amidohydrolase [Gemella sp. zg-1178]